MAKKLVKKDNKKSKKDQAPKSALDDLILADGKVTEPLEDPDIKKVKELEEILGVKKVNPFGTYNLEVFKEKLSDMTNLDLQNLCERVGIFASGSRMQIKEKLLREFKSVARGTISMTAESPSVQLDPNNPLHKRTLKILGEI
jgi:hypothetical protein